jgi:membrane protease YdiL (CAAX protease family)
MTEQHPGQDPGAAPASPQQWPPPQQDPWATPPQQWPPAQPGWAYPIPAAPPPPLPDFPHPEPRPYHLMLRTWNYATWRPIVGIVVVIVGMLIVAPLVLLPVLALGVAVEGGPFWENFQKAATLATVDPAALLYLNLVLGSMILVTWFVMRVFHRMRPRWLMSVRPGIRWKFFFACLGLAVVALAAQVLVGTLLPGNVEGDMSGKLNDFTASSAAIAIIVIFTTPLQAAGEEYVFRGYLMQAFGALFRYKWVAILLTATLFAFAHGVQNFPLFFDRFMFGLIAGWAVTLTGGLEAGIALHILNNFLAFGMAVAFGDLTQTLNVSHVSWWNIVLTLTQSGVYLGLVVLVARRMGLQTETRPPREARGEPVPEVAVG